ncbi:transcription initiation factor IIB [Halococcoides cellulosivorans]|uniref:Transcription initiation factor IIB n=1 Tax=Halococcoides cellulosivorans TaxID=1679096 RepID=A0A2R4X026_9EURY|nr:TFIIB-type zinc ribbon-containing protein [Halococcoides cellulosivorans]AWB27152.1 transcription initiation factor IIB 2 [Halococcoides cellulosivorans]
MSRVDTRPDDGATGEARTDEQRRDARPAQRTECPECGGEVVPDGDVDRVCTDCGAVIETDRIDHGPEWRAFSAAERDERSRVGAPTTKLLHDEGLSTTIGWADVDSSGATLSPEKRSQMRRLRVWDERFRTRDAKDRNLKQALGEIDRMAAAVGLPEDVRETAGVIYRRALDEDLLPGRSIEAMATAALYAAARRANTPRSLDEFEPVSRVPRVEYARAYRYLARELDLGVAPADPTAYLPRYISALDADEDIERRARELLDAAKERGVHSGKDPTGLAAGAIYAASLLVGDRLTQQRIADAADVSAVTIRDRYSELLDARDQSRR